MTPQDGHFHPKMLPRKPKIGKLAFMTARQYQPMRPDQPETDGEEPLLLTESAEEFTSHRWDESLATEGPADAGGRAVLGWALALLAIGWTGYSAWSAGRALATQPLTTPQIAQWIATIAAPLGLLALGWLIFGRTRRKEAERFTRAVVTMRAETRALEEQLTALTRRIDDSRSALSGMASEIEGFAGEAVTRMESATGALGEGANRLSLHGATFDSAAAKAKADLDTLLANLPDAQNRALSLSNELRSAGDVAEDQLARLKESLDAIGAASSAAEAQVRTASENLALNLGQIESVGESTRATLQSADEATKATVDGLLERTAEALGEIRAGIDTQAGAVAALVAQAQAGFAHSGSEAALLLGSHIQETDAALGALAERIARQDEASRRMIADIGSGLGALDQQFAELADQGDTRTNAFRDALAAVREQLQAMGADAATQDGQLEALSGRTATLRDQITTLAHEVSDHLGLALGEAGDKAAQLHAISGDLAPSLATIRDQAVEASEKLGRSADAIESSHERLGQLMGGIDTGVGLAERRLADLRDVIGQIDGDAQRLSAETGPALVDALLQVREAASHAADRAREAIASAIPQSVSQLSSAARAALEKAVAETVERQLRDVDDLAVRAIEAARGATEKLAAQMLSIGQTAGALEAYMNEMTDDERGIASEEFTRRVTYLMEAMNSAAIDVEKILSDEVDEKSWAAYLKGERGVFTRKAVKLLSSSEARAIGQHYADDAEFQQSVNRYVHDFEAMLRRVLAERDGEVMAVTLMSSDMGKLYAALAQAIDRKLSR